MRKSVIFFAVLICSIFGLSQIARAETTATSSGINAVSFIENQGQWDDNVLFMAQSNSLRAWISKDAIVYEQFEKKSKEDYQNQQLSGKPENKVIRACATALRFANFGGASAFENALDGEFNYHIAGKAINGVKRYSNVTVSDVFENIDMKYYFENNELRFDFIVRPGANTDDIQFVIEGATGSELVNGDLTINTDLEDINIKGLKAFQTEDVEAAFKLDGDNLSIEVGAYDNTKTLTIDPLTLITTWDFIESTDDRLSDIKTDDNENTYFCGWTNNQNFPATLGTYQSGADVVVGKTSSSLVLQWATFFGGSASEYAHAIDIDNNYVYFCGATYSTDFPVVRGFQISNLGQTDGFFSVLSLNGVTTEYSTYIGIDGRDEALDLKVVNSKVYLTGYNDGDHTLFDEIGEEQTQTRGVNNMQNAYVIGLEPTGTSPLDYNRIFSSLFGGTEMTESRGIDVDDNENIYIVGFTNCAASTFMPTPGAYDEVNAQWNNTSFISKLHFDGSNLVIDYNTFFTDQTTIGLEGAQKVAFGDDKIFFVGQKWGGGLPTVNAFDNTASTGGYSEAYLSVISPDGNGASDLVYSSYFGGLNASSLYNLEYVEECGRVIFCGKTSGELIGYTGTLNETYSSSTVDMVGIVDITLSGVNTLTDLAYLKTDLTYDNAVAYYGNNIYMASTIFNSNPDMLIYKLNTQICPIYFDCCPPDRDNWLQLTVTKNSEECGPGFCYVDNMFALPPNFGGCFESYSIDDGNTITTRKALLSGQLDDINRCITAGESLTIKVLLWENEFDLMPCIVQQTVECPCNCEGIDDSWIDLQVISGGGTCADDECLVRKTINIPEGFDCFTHYGIDGGAGNPISSPGAIPLPDECIGKASNYTLTISLMRSSDDEDPCVIEKTVYCEIDETETEPCQPDCFDDFFSAQEPITVELENCPGCFITIEYATRIACNTWQDMQLTKIEKYNGGPTYPGIDCNACSDEDIYKQAIKAVIAKNDMGFDPITENDPCSDIWRVSKASCWATWEELIYEEQAGHEPVVVKKVTIHEPCYADCCLRLMRVCRVDDMTVTVKDLGSIYDNKACEEIKIEKPTPPWELVNCVYTCDMLENWEEIFYEKISSEGEIIQQELENLKSTTKSIRLNVFNNTEVFRVFTDKTRAQSINIELFDINGNSVRSLKANIGCGLNNFDIDICALISGTYLYNITIDGTSMKTGKFNIVK